MYANLLGLRALPIIHIKHTKKYVCQGDEEKKFFFLLLKQVVKEKIGFRNEQKALYIAVLKMSSPLCGVLTLNSGIC